MTVKKTGVGSATQDRIIIDAGAVYFVKDSALAGDPDTNNGGTCLGATRGGNVFEINRTIRRMDPDGARGPVKGFRRVEEVVATLTVNLLEITEANLLKALVGSAADSHVISGGDIEAEGADDDYIGSVAIVGTVTDPDLPGTTHPIICRLLNCLVTGPFSLSMSPKDEAVLTVVFEAHYAADALDTEPWSIEYPAV